MTSDNKKEKKKKQITGVVISLVLTVFFLYLAFYGVNLQSLLYYISHASLFWICVLVVTLMLSHFIRAVRWKIIISSVKSDASVTNLLGALMVGYGVNCAIPRLGEISRAVVLGKWEKISATSLVGTVVVERVIDVLGLLFSVIISLYIYSGNIFQSFPWLETSLYLLTAFMIVLIVFLFLLIKLKEKLSQIIVKWVGRVSHKFANKLAEIFEMLIVGFGSLKGFRNYFFTVILTLLLLFVYALNSYIGFYIVGMENVSIGMGWIIMSVSAVGVMIPTPGGTGSYHTLIKSTLILLFGFGEDISLAYAVLTHIVSYILFIVTALFFFFWLNKRYSKLNASINI